LHFREKAHAGTVTGACGNLRCIVSVVDAARAVRAAARLANGEELGLSPDIAAVALLVVGQLSVRAASDLVELSVGGAVVVEAVAVGGVAARDHYSVREVAARVACPNHVSVVAAASASSATTLHLLQGAKASTVSSADDTIVEQTDFMDAARTTGAAARLANGEELGLGKDLAAVALLVVVKSSVRAAAGLVELGAVGAVVFEAVPVVGVAARHHGHCTHRSTFLA
jgi:hypothetical protein